MFGFENLMFYVKLNEIERSEKVLSYTLTYIFFSSVLQTLNLHYGCFFNLYGMVEYLYTEMGFLMGIFSRGF
jgi:hypothetical protein